MQISSPVGHTTPFGSITKANVNNKDTENNRSVRPVEPDLEQEQSANKQAQTSIVIDEQALAHYQQSQNAQTSNDYSSASQDQPSAKNETAVASYQAIDNLAQRESVQQLFGVDLFA